MLFFLLQRLAGVALTLLVASAVVFALLEQLPGNAAELKLGATATPETLAALQTQLGIDRPPLARYADWVGGLLRGETARSSSYDTPTAELIAQRLQVTLPLAVLAMALTSVLALALGLYAAARHRRAGDTVVMALSQLGIAVPNFWFAILLILVFAVQLQWVSAGGFPGWTNDGGGEVGEVGVGGIWPGLQALILPAISLALVQAAILARVTRSAVLDVLREDFMRTARAKGLTRRQALWRHGLRNALIPVLTVAGLQFANLVTGTIVVENVFVLPGIGRLVFQAIANRDLVVVRDVVMLLAAGVVVVNGLVDVLNRVIDPRLRLAGASR